MTDLSLLSLALAFLLLAGPIVLSLVLRVGLIRPLISSVIRMSVQLILIGIFLKYLFQLNSPFVNLLWLAIMILTAVLSAIKSSSLKPVRVVIPVFLSFSVSTIAVILYLNIAVIGLTDIFDARYLIVLGGMVLGNCLRGNIVGIAAFYKNIKTDSKRFLYSLSLGASRYEAILPYLQDSLKLALKPTLASMATMGIVALPGMMTGVILGGASPEVAIKYQIMIVLAIVASTAMSIVITIFATMQVCFGRDGILKPDIFR